MRIKKKELIEMVEQLIEVNTQFDKSGEMPQGVDPAECQELAVKLGNFIEEKYKDSNIEKIIRSLEEYCELLYQTTLPYNKDQIKLHKIIKKMRMTLLSAEHGIEYDLPKDRKQIVFLPYKASMWDSLESIWMEAHKDPEVDDFVIPIPYFDRNPDGTFAEMHYEGDQYPDYVPITDWQKYSIPDEKPDVIFIHNPYDDCNYVTSVHPAFYSRELKKWTECLVYVPYFVIEEIDSNNQRIVDQYMHFISVPAMIFSDKVFVQSENIKRMYVNEYLKFAKETGLNGNHLDRKYQENRILGIGSPKADKIKNRAMTNIQIPCDWQEIINEEKPELIVLYNSSVAPLLNSNPNVYFKRTYEDFIYMKEHNYLVIWRPHPLLKSTIQSMRREFCLMYTELVEQFVEENFGIYDTSSDMYPAIAASDMYMGDMSSVYWLYGLTKKPRVFTIWETKKNDLYNIDAFELNDRNGLFSRVKEEIASISRGDFVKNEIEMNVGKKIYQSIIVMEKRDEY